MLSLCKEIVVFLILAKVLESFQAGNKYAKFVKFIISLIVLLKIITPIISFFESDFNLTDRINEIENRFFIEEANLEEVEAVRTIEMEEISVEVEEIEWEK